MFRSLASTRSSPLGVDIGARSVKLVQLSVDRSKLLDAARWDFAGDAEQEPFAALPGETPGTKGANDRHDAKADRSEPRRATKSTADEDTQEFPRAGNRAKSDDRKTAPQKAAAPAEADLSPADRAALAKRWTDALQQARMGHNFRGKQAVVCLGYDRLFLQNIRVHKSEGEQLQRLVQQEIAGRLPFSIADAEIRYIEAADVRQGENVLREVIVFAVHRPSLDNMLHAVEKAGLTPVAVDVEPLALVRGFCNQYRRDDDKLKRTLLAHVGYEKTMVVITQDDHPLFIKYIPIGGKQFDEAVAEHLEMPLAEAAALRRHNGDRRGDRQDPEVARSMGEATRPVLEELSHELAMCARYHSVTFRGQPLARVVLGGGEATAALAEQFAARLDLPCELAYPLRMMAAQSPGGRDGQWDIAAGLALRKVD